MIAARNDKSRLALRKYDVILRLNCRNVLMDLGLVDVGKWPAGEFKGIVKHFPVK